jgi:catechol 2,3-dioxygenase-like lactoylglutathione lyase family enzyme
VSSASDHRLVAILPCNNVAANRTFYERLGFRVKFDYGDYLILEDSGGANLHLQPAVDGWLVPGRNPFGLYLYAENIDELAEKFAGEILEDGGRAEHKPWGMYEFSLSDPDETLVRIGRKSVQPLT